MCQLAQEFFFAMSKMLGARLRPKWLSHDLLVALIEFLRVELVYALSRQVWSSSGSHFPVSREEFTMGSRNVRAPFAQVMANFRPLSSRRTDSRG